MSVEVRASLNAVATGVLVFLLWDVLAHAADPVEAALTAATVDGTGSWWRFGGLAAVVAACLTLGLMALVYYERWISRPRTAVHERVPGPGAAALTEFTDRHLDGVIAARRLALLIAVGIGLHNFSEGLAIGQSAASGQISLAVLVAWCSRPARGQCTSLTSGSECRQAVVTSGRSTPARAVSALLSG
ncbi:hypothetical protein CH298_26750 [Rhodococcoides fascians]|uniref:hypothetical protein n=1 Tax=Rhodococcoides fascians TaxID=1828 RepID=UPI000B9A63E3|nr:MULTISPECIES: hypothetical protein [Rhodococcus]OZE81369.1 hypothetical protein CH303_27290 [Rhodococcus fascians]OZF10193.1 hypothetical protein CH298_26750 [Rhodococcus fascians]OZF13283.1 hypothetical protein CH297_27040 [Rhodococcus fascians]OZF59381.1 hypothetical protein CH308_27490 [Rhodococcus fascians]OZF60496.1 hypothetical protein CH307_27675 [Rhodococcus fascians]